MITFNIGTAVNGLDNCLNASTIINSLEAHGFTVLALRLQQSGTENTAIVQAAWPYGLTRAAVDNRVYCIADCLQQEAIAYLHEADTGSYGELVGPNAADWGGKFDPSQFIKWEA